MCIHVSRMLIPHVSRMFIRVSGTFAHVARMRTSRLVHRSCKGCARRRSARSSARPNRALPVQTDELNR
eukprot:5108781-Pyramimonas_sp.AAC.1